MHDHTSLKRIQSHRAVGDCVSLDNEVGQTAEQKQCAAPLSACKAAWYIQEFHADICVGVAKIPICQLSGWAQMWLARKARVGHN